MTNQDAICLAYGRSVLSTDALSLDQKRKLYTQAKQDFSAADNKTTIVEPDFLALVAAALTGVCASHATKFDCQSRLEIARTAVGIARMTVYELHQETTWSG